MQSKINATEGSEEQLTGASEVEFSIPKAPAGDVVEKKYVMDVGELYPEFTSGLLKHSLTVQQQHTVSILGLLSIH